VCQCKLVNPEEATDQERLNANEVEFLTKVRSHFGRKTALDTLYHLDKIKLFAVTTDKVAGYIRRYQEALRLMSEEETISGDNLYSHFMRGIKHRQFRIRMEAALQDEPKDIDTFT
ncbi:hypothetical protein ADUPG1_002789, partial [Aduncisulcus paluster]